MKKTTPKQQLTRWYVPDYVSMFKGDKPIPPIKWHLACVDFFIKEFNIKTKNGRLKNMKLYNKYYFYVRTKTINCPNIKYLWKREQWRRIKSWKRNIPPYIIVRNITKIH